MILLFPGVFQYEAVIEIPAEFFNDEARRKRQDSTQGIDSLIAEVCLFEILQTNYYDLLSRSTIIYQVLSLVGMHQSL